MGIIRTLIDYEKLESYQERLNYLAQEKTSCLKSFRLFFQHGASPKESLTLKSIRKVMRHYLSNISAGISHSWEKYCELDTQTNQFQFFPDLFIEPLQYQLEFRKLIAHTQLFVSHIEEKHNISSTVRSASRGVNALVIANWVYKKWKKYTFSKLISGELQCINLSKSYENRTNYTRHVTRNDDTFRSCSWNRPCPFQLMILHKCKHLTDHILSQC